MASIESSIVRAVLNGDSTAFANLVELYQEKLYQLAYRMLYNRQEAEDVVQETFLRVFKSLANYDESMKFSTWIYRIATNLCIDQLRKKRGNISLDAEVHDEDGIDGYAQLQSAEPLPEEELIMSEMQRSIQQAIQEMPVSYRSVTILKYLHDLSLQEISEILELPVSTIKTRLHRGREHLRGVLSPPS